MEAYRVHIIYQTTETFPTHHYKEFKERGVESTGSMGLSCQVLTPKHRAERYAEQVVISGFWIRGEMVDKTINDFGDWKMVPDDDKLVPPARIMVVRVEPIT